MEGKGTHRENFIKNYEVADKPYSLKALSKISKVPVSVLQEVYNRGVGAYKGNPTSVRLKNSYVKNVKAPPAYKLSKEQWAMARVYSFLDGNPKHDNDLRMRGKGDEEIKGSDFLEGNEDVFRKSDFLSEDDVEVTDGRIRALPNFDVMGRFTDGFIERANKESMEHIRDKKEPLSAEDKQYYLGQIGKSRVFMKARKKILDDIKRERASEKEAFGAQLKSKLVVPEFIAKGRYRGGAIPDRAMLVEIAKASYSPTPPANIGNSVLVSATPTLKFYLDGNTVIVAVRGSKTAEDWVLNNPLIAFNQLKSGTRFKADAATIRAFQQSYPKGQYQYYGVGHSLGGALMDEFISEGLLDNGISFNPAVQSKDLGDTKNQRVYHEGDALYQTMGVRLKNAPEVRRDEKKSSSWWSNLTNVMNPSVLGYTRNTVGDYIKAHNLKSFSGGAKDAERQKKWIQDVVAHMKTGAFTAQSARVGKTPTQYAKEVLAHPEKHTITTRRRAQFLENIKKLK